MKNWVKELALKNAIQANIDAKDQYNFLAEKKYTPANTVNADGKPIEAPAPVIAFVVDLDNLLKDYYALHDTYTVLLQRHLDVIQAADSWGPSLLLNPLKSDLIKVYELDPRSTTYEIAEHLKNELDITRQDLLKSTSGPAELLYLLDDDNKALFGEKFIEQIKSVKAITSHHIGQEADLKEKIDAILKPSEPSSGPKI